MTTLYKLTTFDHMTRPGFPNGCKWGPGVTHSGTGKGPLCGPGWIHAYTHPLLAVFLNPIHGGYTCPVLWEAEGEVACNDSGLKVGCLSLTTRKILDLPRVSPAHAKRFAVICGRRVMRDRDWCLAADEYLKVCSVQSIDILSGALLWGADHYAVRHAVRDMLRYETCNWGLAATAVEAAAHSALSPIDLIAAAEEAVK